MKKIIVFLLLTVAYTTNAQTVNISGDDTFGEIKVSISINGGIPTDIGYLQKGHPLSYTIPSNFNADNDLLEIIAETQNAYLFIESNDQYYQFYLDYLNETNTYFDNPANSYIYDANMLGTLTNGGYANCFIGTLPELP